MDLVCKNCDHQNSSDAIFCLSCNTPLGDVISILNVLLKKQEALENRHLQELDKLKKEISSLRQSLVTQKTVVDKPITTTHSLEQKPVDSISDTTASKPKLEEDQLQATGTNLPQKTFQNPKSKEVKVYKPSSLKLGIKRILEPLHAGISLLSNIYDKYKQEGKLPIFFMTLAGILAILFGFGYLLQYSLKYLGNYAEVAKIGLGFIFSFTVGGIGIHLYSRNENYQEYGSALISLGIILNYLLIYFLSDLGNFPILSSGILGFSLIILNTIIAILLSLRFKTKIIAVLFLIGGALAPFYLNSNSDGSLYYLYLWLLTIGANVVAQRINWKTLHYLSFIVSLGLLEVMVFTYQPDTNLFTAYYHLYAYLFFYYSIFNKYSIRKSLEKHDILILAGNLSLFVFNLYTSYTQQFLHLGLLYGLNAIIFSALLLRFWKFANANLKLTFFIIIGSFIGFSIPALVHQSLMGLFWSTEAIVLIILGFTYNIPLVRKEGYVVLLLAIVKLGFSSGLLMEHWFTNIWHEGFLNYCIFGLVITALWYAGQKFSNIFNSFENSLFAVFKEIIPLWLSSMFLIAAYGLVDVWAFNLAIIPAFGLVYWCKRFRTLYTDRIAIFHFLLLIVSIANSGIETQSIHFSDQLLYAKISMLELMASLFLFRKYCEVLNHKETDTFAFAHIMQITFFVLLPLIFIHIIRRHAIEFISPAVWLAFLMSYLLYKKLNYRALLIEANLLATGSILVSFISMNEAGLAIGIFLLAAIIYVEKGHLEEGINQSSFRELMVITPYAIAISAATLHHQINSEDPGTSTGIFSLILFISVYFKDRLIVMKRSYKIGMQLASFINLIAISITLFEESLLGVAIPCLNLVLFGLMLQNKSRWYPTDRETARWIWAVIAHQLQMLLFYSLVLILLDIDLSGILATVILVIHAIMILFVSLKNQLTFLNKVSFTLFGLALLKVVFNDIRGFETSEKIIVLIVIGVLLLGASYAYLKLKKYFENQALKTAVSPRPEKNQTDG